MDEIQNSVDSYREIEEALSHGFGLRDKAEVSSSCKRYERSAQEDDLEKELDGLLQENKEKATSAPVRLPDVPSRSFGITDIDMEDDSLEKRLQRLREAA